MTEVFINDYYIELSSNNDVSQTFQLGDIGDISTRQTSYTNKFKAPKTPNNILAFNCLGMIGKEHYFDASQFPYGTPSAKIVESGIELVSNGLAIISETNDNYEITIYGSEKSFYEKISDLTLQDCYPDTLFTYTAENVANAFDRSDNYIFTLLYYNNFTRTSDPFGGNNDAWFSSFRPFVKLWPERMTPQFFWKSLFQNIFNYVGYTVINPVANSVRFQNLLTNASTSILNFNIQYGQEVNFKNVAPVMSCSDFLKEVMMRFGLLIRVDELQKRVEFKRIEDLITNSSTEDWSSKFSSMKKEVYKLSKYGRINEMNHPNDSGEDIKNESVKSYYYNLFDNELTGTFTIKSSQLENDKTNLFTSKFSKPTLLKYSKGEVSNTYNTDTSGIWENFGSFRTGSITYYSYNKTLKTKTFHLIDMLEYEYNGDYPSEDYNTIKSITKEFEPQVFYRYKLGFQIKMRLPDNSIQTFNIANTYIAQYKEEYEQYSSTTGRTDTTWPPLKYENSVNNPLVSFQVFLGENYTYTIKTLNKIKVINCLMNLSVLDIYALDFFKRKHIKQLGANFYLNKVSNYKSGKLTECEFIKIPSNFDEETYYNKDSQIIGIL